MELGIGVYTIYNNLFFENQYLRTQLNNISNQNTKLQTEYNVLQAQLIEQSLLKKEMSDLTEKNINLSKEIKK